ncbi:MAG TPA: ATP synthase F1 subunit gamma [Vicinamibacterales bacterium]|jgi:F-type H+-transporting ATPase subunit gamma|nr:ATP synthase F1 subunit gamma [Vicinamibacterales bacterium]
MPSLLDIRRRIRAVKSTQQITKAMKMVAASRLRRAQERIQHARPFANEMLRVLNSLATRVDPGSHPLLDERATRLANGKSLLFVITADRGLAGSFNANAIKAASTFIVEDPAREVALGLIGRRGRDFFARRGFEVRYEQVNLFQALQYGHAQEIAAEAIAAFTGGAVDSVYLIYNEFRSVIQQRIVVERLLPIPRLDIEPAAPQPGTSAGSDGTPPIDYLYEPSPEELFSTLIPRHVEVQVFRALLESNAAFYAAQMTAMDSASRNAAEMIDQLTLYMNKVRQAAITREIIEVVSGAEAL